MMSEPSKQTRARSKIAKEKQFLRIIDIGRKMFLKYGSRGIKMRTLAKELGFGSNSASSLYTYVNSKRELWFAIMKHDFKDFENGLESVAQNHKGTMKQLLVKIAHFYLHFAFEDPKRYQMMFEIPAPISNKIGPFEQTYESKSVYFLKNIISQVLVERNLNEREGGKYAFFLWGILHGPIAVIDTDLFGNSSQIPDIGSREQYLAFLKDKMEQVIESLL